MRQIESALIEAGAKAGTDYTLMQLVGITQAQMQIEALGDLAENIKEGLFSNIFGSLSDTLAKGMSQSTNSRGLADAVADVGSALDDIARKMR